MAFDERNLMMESRTTTSMPAGGNGGKNSPPPEWKNQSVLTEMGREPDQGAMKTSRPMMRELNPVAGAQSRDYSRSMLANRPGVVAQRSLAPLPGEVVTVLEQGVGGAVAQHLAGTGGFTPTAPGNNDNVAGNGDFTGACDYAKGSASRTTGRVVKGQTAGKGMI